MQPRCLSLTSAPNHLLNSRLQQQPASIPWHPVAY